MDIKTFLSRAAQRATGGGGALFYLWVVLWFVLAMLSLAYSDPDEKCQHTTFDVAFTASTWLAVYGATSLWFVFFVLGASWFSVCFEEDVYFCTRFGFLMNGVLLWTHWPVLIIAGVYGIFYIVWTVYGIILLLTGTLDCFGVSQMFGIMVADLTPAIFLFFRVLFAPSVTIAVSNEQIDALTAAIGKTTAAVSNEQINAITAAIGTIAVSNKQIDALTAAIDNLSNLNRV